MKFYKMHGTGNDYIYFDGITAPIDVDLVVENIVKMSHRNFGIGSDGVVLLLPSDNADVLMRMFNCFDGSEAENCGNALRCIGRLAYELGIVDKHHTIENIVGDIVEAEVIDDEEDSVKIKMAFPPIVSEEQEQTPSADKNFNFYRVSVGNPHAVIKVDNVKDMDLEKYGNPIENNLDLFPERTNVEFYQPISEDTLCMRVWERGSGETLSCGTGTCATAAAYRHSIGNKVDKVTVKTKGGNITLTWEGDDFYMTGGATLVFSGDIELKEKQSLKLISKDTVDINIAKGKEGKKTA